MRFTRSPSASLPPLTEKEKDTVRPFAKRWRDNARLVSEKRDKIAAMPIKPVITDAPKNKNKRNIFTITAPKALKNAFTIIPHSFKYDPSKSREEQPESFLRSLSKAWEKASSEMGHQPFELQFIKSESRSAHWVAGLLLENCPDFTPQAIRLYAPQRQTNSLDHNDKEYETNNIVLVDDASYSGSQISAHLKMLIDEKARGKHIHIVIPYISYNAKVKISTLEQKAKELEIKLHIHSTEKIELSPLASQEKIIDCIKHTTIFSHKIADFISLGEDVHKHTNSFAPPYKSRQANIMTYALARQKRKELYRGVSQRENLQKKGRKIFRQIFKN